MARRVLLVEGSTDKYFFQLLLEKIKIENVEVLTPDEAGSEGTGVDAILKKGGSIKKDGTTTEAGSLHKQLAEIKRGATERLAIIIDADSINDNKSKHGYDNRYKEVANILVDFPTNSSTLSKKGIIFQRDDTPNIHIGLWIMTNSNDQEGMFEDFLLPCIEENQHKKLLTTINGHIENLKIDEDLKPICFTDNHKSKVIFSTWLDWHKQPNNCRALSPACAFKHQWINPDHDNIKALTTWLTRVFQ